MPPASQKPIELTDLTYRIRKFILIDDQEIKFGDPKMGQVVRVMPHHIAGQLRFLLLIEPPVRIGKIPVSQICYQVEHGPTGLFSPIYDHEFSDETHSGKSIGPMKLYPAEAVWPELTAKGYYGELPQFYT